MSFIRLK